MAGPTRSRLWAIAASLLLFSGQLLAQQVAAGVLPDEPLPQNQPLAPQDQTPAQDPAPTPQSKGQIAPSSQVSVPVMGGSISGVVVDSTGAALTTAVVRLTPGDASRSSTAKTDSGGGFTFANVGSGAFVISVAAPGFMTVSMPGSLSAGQILTLPAVTLTAGSNIEIQVGETREEMAQEQLNVETKQRFLGVIPNYYMSYAANPIPLTPRQKFTLAGRFMLDPVNFGITGLNVAVEEANDDYSGFGRGAGGYGKRYAAATGTFFSGTLLGGALLPSILHQDPRYFYKGTGSIKSRTLYAIANAVICKGDNGHWQFNVSSIGGGLAAGAISNFYYPAANRDGVESTFVELAIGLAESAAGNVAQEFLFRKLTTHAKQAGTTP